MNISKVSSLFLTFRKLDPRTCHYFTKLFGSCSCKLCFLMWCLPINSPILSVWEWTSLVRKDCLLCCATHQRAHKNLLFKVRLQRISWSWVPYLNHPKKWAGLSKSLLALDLHQILPHLCLWKPIQSKIYMGFNRFSRKSLKRPVAVLSDSMAFWLMAHLFVFKPLTFLMKCNLLYEVKWCTFAIR